jgi:hypothetical protein
MEFPDKWTIATLGAALRAHMEKDEIRDTQQNEVYKAVVIGNGEPPLKETVHNHARWISNVNRIAWAILLAFITQFFAYGCVAIILIIKIIPLLTKIDTLGRISKIY